MPKPQRRAANTRKHYFYYPGVYLIAWHGHTPVGHFLQRWSGPQDAHVVPYVDVTQSAYLEAGATRVDYRRKGVSNS